MRRVFFNLCLSRITLASSIHPGSESLAQYGKVHSGKTGTTAPPLARCILDRTRSPSPDAPTPPRPPLPRLTPS